MCPKYPVTCTGRWGIFVRLPTLLVALLICAFLI